MQNCHLSFEFFPPKTPEAQKNLLETAKNLQEYDPDFFSLTYGAGGSAIDRTIDMVNLMVNHHTVAPHLTLGKAGEEEALKQLLSIYDQKNIQHIVALRGDHLPIETPLYASNLVELIQSEHPNRFTIAVGAYPETHPTTENMESEIKYLSQKVKAGANLAITQYFYNAEAYFYYVEHCRKAGITIPIIPGIMPITHYNNILKFSQQCGATIPRWLERNLHIRKKDTDSLIDFGIEVVSKMCKQLLSEGAPGLHFYTLNVSSPTLRILDTLPQFTKSDTKKNFSKSTINSTASQKSTLSPGITSSL